MGRLEHSVGFSPRCACLQMRYTSFPCPSIPTLAISCGSRMITMNARRGLKPTLHSLNVRRVSRLLSASEAVCAVPANPASDGSASRRAILVGASVSPVHPADRRFRVWTEVHTPVARGGLIWRPAGGEPGATPNLSENRASRPDQLGRERPRTGRFRDSASENSHRPGAPATDAERLAKPCAASLGAVDSP